MSDNVLIFGFRLRANLDVFDTDSVGLCNGAYGCDAVGVDELDWPGL